MGRVVVESADNEIGSSGNSASASACPPVSSIDSRAVRVSSGSASVKTTKVRRSVRAMIIQYEYGLIGTRFVGDEATDRWNNDGYCRSSGSST